MITDASSVDVAIVGGGPAGAALAIRTASAGRSVVVLERSPRWRWRACGVFAGPVAVRELRALGLGRDSLDAVARPVPGMQVETTRQHVFRLTYGAGADGDDGAVGFDRAALDGTLLERAAAAGAMVLRGHDVRTVELAGPGGRGRVTARGPAGTTTISAGIVVGADGLRSVVARAARVTRPARLGSRVGLTWHIADPAGDAPHDARMVVVDGAYCGLAPVPRGRINVGIVLSGRERLRALATRGAAAVAGDILAEALDRPHGAARERAPAAVDAIAGAVPIGHRVSRRGGPGWMLIGDAAGFLDPFTGEGMGRALVSARLAADALLLGTGPLAYDRAMRQRFATKDLLSLVVQGFLASPRLFDYAARRLAGREPLRETMGLVIGDLEPARRALDPRFVAALLAP